VAAGQLWLFDPPKPLVERFGKDFFRALPERPGVYLMCGASEGVLYVGKARNLRKRLAAYRVANPERMSRRMIRLLNQTRRIEWDECRDEQTAGYREELLICVLAPKFNSVGKVWPGRGTKRLNSQSPRAFRAASGLRTPKLQIWKTKNGMGAVSLACRWG
jgi:predicted GIY-YIG superfamily endonuclease